MSDLLMSILLLLCVVVSIATGRDTLVLSMGEMRVVRVTNASLMGAMVASLAARPDTVCMPLQWAPQLDVTPVDCAAVSIATVAPSKCFNVSGNEAMETTVRVACLQQNSANLEGFLRVQIIDTPPTCENFTMQFNPARWTSSTYMEFRLRASDLEGRLLFMFSNSSFYGLKGTLQYCPRQVCRPVNINDWGVNYNDALRYFPPKLALGESETLKYVAVDESMNGCGGTITFLAADIPPAALLPIPNRVLFAMRGVLIGASLVAENGSPSMIFKVLPPTDPTCVRICTPSSYVMQQIVDVGSVAYANTIDLYCTRDKAITAPTDISAFHFRHRVAYAIVVPLRACLGNVTFTADNSNGLVRTTTMSFSSFVFQCRAAAVEAGESIRVSRILALVGTLSGSSASTTTMQFVVNDIFKQNSSKMLNFESLLTVRQDAKSGVVTFRSDELPALACYVTVASSSGSAMMGSTTLGLGPPFAVFLVVVILIGGVYSLRERFFNAVAPRRNRLATAAEDSDEEIPSRRGKRPDPFRSNSPPSAVKAATA